MGQIKLCKKGIHEFSGKQCLKCQRISGNKAKKKWSLANPDTIRNTRFFRVYGIMLWEYKHILLKQSSCCAICGKHQSKFNSLLCVDHCHITKKVRGLLCRQCNMGIGFFNDDPKMIKKAMGYLLGSN